MSTTTPGSGQTQTAEEKRRLLAQLLQQKATRPSHFPLTSAQQRLWFLNQFEPGTSLYNMPWTFRLRGALDVAALERALGEIIRRHEILRTVFSTIEGEPVQVVSPPGPWPLPVEDVPGADEAEREAELLRRLQVEATRPFDLETGPLFRGVLLRCGPREHVISLCMHHIVSDGWSMEVLYKELAALYDAFRRGEKSPLPELPIQYADFAVWQQERLRAPVVERQLEFWKQHLAGTPATLDLPTDRPRPAAQSFRGALVPFALDAGPTQLLHRLARREAATLFMVLLAAFKVLLSRYASQEDVVVGTPMAGRTRRETEGLIGLFVNTLALRTDLSGDPLFPEVLRRVREALLGGHANQEVPFERLVGELNVERSLSHTPVFQVMMATQGLPHPFTLGDIRAEPISGDIETAKFDLAFVVEEEGSGLVGILEYATDLFDRSTAERMLRHFRALVEAIGEDPDRRISALPLLSDPERRQLLEEWGRAERRDVRGGTLHGAVLEQAARTPDRVAVECGADRITYAELERRSARLADHLRSLGVGPESRVGIFVERSVDMVVALLGTLRAGGAYLPLDPVYPRERLAYMLADSGAKVLLTHEPLLEVLPEFAGAVVRMDADAPAIARYPEQGPESGAGPDNLAYVIYTSGSTGRPKGVMVPHAGVVNLFDAMRRTGVLGADDVLLSVTTLSFDIATQEIFLPLVSGARLVVGTRDVAADGISLAALMDRCGATVVQATPATWRMLVQSGWGGRPGLRVICGGEALPAELAAEVLPRCRELLNMYGPTEATIWSTVHPVAGGRPGSVPLGRPVPNTTTYVLDGHLHPAPVGVPGELFLGGAQVARGYLGRPDLTAERFVPDPFADAPGARMYRTGDRVRWLPDGELEYLGRTDFQVKVRGFRIELGEIESALLAQEGVREAVVTVRGDAGDPRLVAYLVGAPDAVAAGRLRDGLRERLPEYMVPSAFVALDALPLTPNGKVDRKALPDPDWSGEVAAYVAPRTGTEEVLCRLWSRILGVERVGVHDNFFALGGHSLKGTQLIFAVREELGAEITVRTLFERPTVAGLAEAISGAPAEEEIGIIGRGAAEQLLADLDHLSEEQVERLLNGLSLSEG